MGPTRAAICIDVLASEAHSFSALAAFRPPPAAPEDWPVFCRLMQSLAALDPDSAAWQSQVGETRRWYRPHLERIYDTAETREADLEQLEQISGRYPTRERFLTELTLDPPAAAGDLAGDPLLDEDYLVLSTVHSAKGQEWKSVFVLNFSDGSFRPNSRPVNRR
jgi:DNA helicase-2/ATP-dependent DNA helicase PcrA